MRIILILSVFLSFRAFAQVNIDYKMKLLEENVQNSQSNFDKYKENLKISVKNFNEATRIVNELRGLKKQAVRDSKRSKSNALVFGQVIDKYTDFVAKEQANILKEEEAVRKLEQLILSVKENTNKRRNLIASYNEQVELARAEITKWRQKDEDVKMVMKDISEREVGALEERKLWGEKKETYRTETKKWAKEAGRAKRTLATFERLRAD